MSLPSVIPLSWCTRVGNMLFSVETQTTEERTQQYQSEVESIYKDLTAKGKALMLSTELGVRSSTVISSSRKSLVTCNCSLRSPPRSHQVICRQGPYSPLHFLCFQDADAVCNLILSLVYYFCNLMPLSRGSR